MNCSTSKAPDALITPSARTEAAFLVSGCRGRCRVQRSSFNEALSARSTSGGGAQLNGLPVRRNGVTDTQVVELLGRNRLIDELLRAGLEVAIPERDRGIDLIAYLDLDPNVGYFIARRIQMKVASQKSFSISRKYEKFPDLILAFVWHVRSASETCTFAISHPDALVIGTELGWTKTSSWRDKGHYTTQKPSAQLLELLEPHRMSNEAWRSLVTRTHAA
jgi:hypothetical protein